MLKVLKFLHRIFNYPKPPVTITVSPDEYLQLRKSLVEFYTGGSVFNQKVFKTLSDVATANAIVKYYEWSNGKYWNLCVDEIESLMMKETKTRLIDCYLRSEI